MHAYLLYLRKHAVFQADAHRIHKVIFLFENKIDANDLKKNTVYAQSFKPDSFVFHSRYIGEVSDVRSRIAMLTSAAPSPRNEQSLDRAEFFALTNRASGYTIHYETQRLINSVLLASLGCDGFSDEDLNYQVLKNLPDSIYLKKKRDCSTYRIASIYNVFTKERGCLDVYVFKNSISAMHWPLDFL